MNILTDQSAKSRQSSQASESQCMGHDRRDIVNLVLIDVNVDAVEGGTNDVDSERASQAHGVDLAIAYRKLGGKPVILELSQR